MKRIASWVLLIAILVSALCVLPVVAKSDPCLEASAYRQLPNGRLILELTALKATSSGQVEILYDATQLKLLEAKSPAKVMDYADSDSTVTAAWADTQTIAVGQTVLTAEFSVVTGSPLSPLTVKVTDFNDKENKRLGTMVVPLAAPTHFEDVDDNAWYADAVRFVTENGYFKGITKTQFAPYAPMTRGMFVTVLGRYEGTRGMTGTFFDDVAPNRYYAPFAAWGASTGIVKGMSERIFAPDENVTRQQMATFMYRLAQFQGEDVTASPEKFNAFPDSGEVSGWAMDAMIWATDRGIIQGSSGYLRPHDAATRAEAAQVIMNLAQKEG